MDISEVNECKGKQKPVDLEEKLLFGQCHDVKIPENLKIVRIFTSSTFTDTAEERNYLMVHVYPELTKYCNSIGYEFQVVDMRWGIRDESTADHMTSEICLNEIRKCQQISTGPSFVTFLGQKYGWRPLPRMISDTEFKKILSGLNVLDEIELLKRWYIIDRNDVPVHHYLQPLSTEDLSNLWWKHDSHKVADILRSVAKTVLSKEDSEKYYISVTESEIQEGLMNDVSPEKHCHWFKRTIIDLAQYNEKKTANYVDKIGPSLVTDGVACEMLEELKTKKLPSFLVESMVTNFEVNWAKNKGIDVNLESHKLYLEQFGKCFQEVLTQLIDKGVAERKNNVTSNALQMEISHHMLMKKTKCQGFVGQENVLAAIHEYILSSDISMPLVIYGESGTGKTSVMAEAARRAALTYPEDAVVLRFLGTSAQSSDIDSVLKSVNEQIKQIDAIRGLKLDEVDAFQNELYGDVWRKFSTRLSIISKKVKYRESKLIIFLDSLDQLSDENKPKRMEWLPKDLGPSVRVVVSTLPGKKHVYLPRIKNMYEGIECIEVNTLNIDNTNSIINSWKMLNQRTLSPSQATTIVEKFQQHSFPLYLKLLLDQAKTWTENTFCRENLLTIKDCINYLFDSLERKHGHVLVSHAFALICASRAGLSDSEMDDLLSLDDTVLNNVCQYWDTPIRRIPPLLWIRLKSDINEYIVSRAINGIEVNFWFHRQFIEVSTQRYFSEPEKWFKLLAEYFSGEWSGVPKPSLNKDQTIGEARDRLVRPQPIIFGSDDDGKGNVNSRKIYHLPHSLIQANQVEKFKELVLFNFDFMRYGLSTIRSFLEEARSKFQSDDDIKQFYIFYKSIVGEDISHASDLASQIIGRLSKLSNQRHFVRLFEDIEIGAACGKWKISPVLGEVFPSIVRTIVLDHKEKLSHMEVTRNGTMLYCVSKRNFMSYDFVKDEYLSSIVMGPPVYLFHSIQNGDRVVFNGIETFLVESGNFVVPTEYYNYKSLDFATCLNEKVFLRLTKDGLSVFDMSKCRYPTATMFEKVKQAFIGSENTRYRGRLAVCDNFCAYINTGESLDKIYVGKVKDFKLKILKEIEHKGAGNVEPGSDVWINGHRRLGIRGPFSTVGTYMVFSRDGNQLICASRDMGKSVIIKVYETGSWVMREYVFGWESGAAMCSYFTLIIHQEEHFVIVFTDCLLAFNMKSHKAKYSSKKHLPNYKYLLATAIDNTSTMIAVHEDKQCVYVYDLNMFDFNDLGMNLTSPKRFTGLSSLFNQFTVVFGSYVQVWTSGGKMLYQYNTPENARIMQASLVSRTRLVVFENLGKMCKIASTDISEERNIFHSLKDDIEMEGECNCQIKTVGNVFGLLTNLKVSCFTKVKDGCLMVFDATQDKELLVAKPCNAFSLSYDARKAIVQFSSDNGDTWKIYNLCNGHLWRTVTHPPITIKCFSASIWCMTENEKYFIYSATGGMAVYVYNLEVGKIDDTLRYSEPRTILDIHFTPEETIEVTTATAIMVFNKKPQPKWKKEENWDYKSAQIFFYGFPNYGPDEIVFSSNRTKLVALEKHGSVVSAYDTTKRAFRNLDCHKVFSPGSTIQSIASSSDNSIALMIDERLVFLKMTEHYLKIN